MYPYNQNEPYYSAPQVSPWHYGWPIYPSAPPAAAPDPLSSTYPTFASRYLPCSAAEFCRKDAVCQTDHESEFCETPARRFLPSSEFDRSICTVSPVKSPRNFYVSRSGGPMPNYGQLSRPFVGPSRNVSSFSHQNGELPIKSSPSSTSSLSPIHLTDQDIRRAKVITKWALINMKESGECCVASFANGHTQLMYSNAIISVHRSGRIVDDGNGLYRLSGGLYWRAYRLMFPNFEEKYLPPKLSSAFSNGFPHRRWRRWTRRLYLFLSQFLDSSEDDTSGSENTPFPAVQRRTCDFDESVIGNLVEKAADRVFSRPTRPEPLHASENTPFPTVQRRACDLDESVIGNLVQKAADRVFSPPTRPVPLHRTPILETSPTLSAAPVMALSKTANQKRATAVETGGKDCFIDVGVANDNASVSSVYSSASRVPGSGLSHRRSRGRPRKQRPVKTKSESSRLKTRVQDDRRKSTGARSVELNRKKAKTTGRAANPPSTSSSRSLRKARRKSMFSPYLRSSADKDPKFLLFKENGEAVDVRKLPRTRSGRLSVPMLDVAHRQDIISSSSGLIVKHGEPEKFFSSFVDS